MSLLDDLEQEAKRLKLTAGDVQQRKLAREEFFKNQIAPRVNALSEYLERLVANLKALKPAKPWRYNMPGYGQIVAHCEHDYELTQNVQPDSHEIRIAFHCEVAPEECPAVEVEGIKVKALSGTFGRHNLAGQMSDVKKGPNGEMLAATFRARGRIAALATFAADADAPVLKMSFTNIDAFGNTVKTTSLGALNDELFDDIGRYLAREENTLLREALPDDYRAQLRSAVERNQVKQRWELKIASQRKSELAALKRAHGSGESLLGRLRSLISKGQ